MCDVHYLLQEVAPISTHMSYESFLTIVLTSLCVILAALALGIGALAVWGYNGIQEAVTKRATNNAEAALAAKMQEYPDAKEIITVFRKFQEHVQFMESIREQMATGGSNNVAEASNLVQDESAGRPADSIAADYPSVQEVDIDVKRT